MASASIVSMQADKEALYAQVMTIGSLKSTDLSLASRLNDATARLAKMVISIDVINETIAECPSNMISQYAVTIRPIAA